MSANVSAEIFEPRPECQEAIFRVISTLHSIPHCYCSAQRKDLTRDNNHFIVDEFHGETANVLVPSSSYFFLMAWWWWYHRYTGMVWHRIVVGPSIFSVVPSLGLIRLLTVLSLK